MPCSATNDGKSAHISLVFREMWDSMAVHRAPYPYWQHVFHDGWIHLPNPRAEHCGPTSRESERDVGHPSFVTEQALRTPQTHCEVAGLTVSPHPLPQQLIRSNRSLPDALARGMVNRIGHRGARPQRIELRIRNPNHPLFSIPCSATNAGSAHISLVFREMWDSAAIHRAYRTGNGSSTMVRYTFQTREASVRGSYISQKTSEMWGTRHWLRNRP